MYLHDNVELLYWNVHFEKKRDVQNDIIKNDKKQQILKFSFLFIKFVYFGKRQNYYLFLLYKLTLRTSFSSNFRSTGEKQTNNDGVSEKQTI